MSCNTSLNIELKEEIENYVICTLCEFDLITIKKEDIVMHYEKAHNCIFDDNHESIDEIFKDEETLISCYNTNTVIELRKDLCNEKQEEFYKESGSDLSIFEATETLKTAIKLFLTEFKRKIVALNFPQIQVKGLENDELNKFLDINQGVYYFYSLIEIGNIEDITVQLLLARSWDWSEEDQDLRKDIVNIRNKILTDDKHCKYKEATHCISIGKLLLLTMIISVKHLLLLCYLTKRIIKRQE